MINFRFHLVSLVAVFLALALGVVMGSTVIDRAIVDRLSSQIDSVKKRADAERAENRALRDQMKGLENFIAQSQPQVTGRRPRARGALDRGRIQLPRPGSADEARPGDG